MNTLTYDRFLDLVCDLGFLLLAGEETRGFPTLSDYVPESQWWTEDPETDPWVWKDRAPMEKRLAYGSFFGGKKGYIAPRFYSVFADAFRPRMDMADRWATGQLSRYEWAFWNLLPEVGRPVGTHEYRRMIPLNAGGKSALDAAVASLQMTFDVVVSGTADMLDKSGKPYNKSMAYDRADNWVPDAWLTLNPPMDQADALEAIYRRCAQLGKALTRAQIARPFEKSRKLLSRFG